MTKVQVMRGSELDIEPYDGTIFEKESLTKQSDAKDADINVIVSRYEKTGIIPVNTREALFLDVSAVGSYQEIRDHINLATEYFMQLPADVRAKFDNDPNVFLDRAVDPTFRESFVELGLLEKDATPSTETASGASAAPSSDATAVSK